MAIALPVMVGEESGEDCSARVEWCKLVAAREKSRPRERLGSTLVGLPYVCEWSSLGERGVRLIYADVLADIKSRGICKDRPRAGKAGLRGVVMAMGELGSPRSLSSFDIFFAGSRNLGDGERAGGWPASDKERVFDLEGDLEGILRSGVEAVAVLVVPSGSSMEVSGVVAMADAAPNLASRLSVSRL